MKNKLNKKGFTLVELLAVIVVLAIIMVIATTQITGVIKKNTVDSFSSSLDVVAKAAKTIYLQFGDSITAEDIKANVDYDPNQYEITLEGEKDSQKVCITSVADGKFSDMDVTYFPDGDWSKDERTEISSTDSAGEIKKEENNNFNQTTACKEFK